MWPVSGQGTGTGYPSPFYQRVGLADLLAPHVAAYADIA